MLAPQFQNKVVSSFLLWMDHNMLQKGQAHQSGSFLFYPIDSKKNGLNTYSAPYKGFVSDRSISGAAFSTGIYLNGNFIITGQSGFQGINYQEGQVYFSSSLPANTRISGNFSVKEFNVLLTNKPEEKLLFETKYSLAPKIQQTPTGLNTDTTTYPLIYIKNYGSENQPFAFGGTDSSVVYIRSIVMADSQYNLDAVCSLFQDKVRTFIPLVENNEMPYNYLGMITGVYNFERNYTGRFQKSNSCYIDKVRINGSNSRFYDLIRELNPEIYLGIMDFEICTIREPRNC